MTDRPGTDQQPNDPTDTPDAPYVQVTFGDQYDPSTWRRVRIQTGIRNRVAYEVEAHRRGWPMITDGGIYLMWRYIAWDALHAHGDFPGTFPDFAQEAWDVKTLDPPADAQVSAGPTQPEPSPA